MIPIKALTTGLVGTWLCMANISGIVTDTGTTPISGALVQLENGGQTAITGADGSFTLVISTAIRSAKSRSLQDGLSAMISGNALNLTIVERSVVEVATYDLSGKAISLIQQTLNAGTHNIAFPYRGKGVYLYKVKAGNNELVLKDYVVNGVSFGSAVLSKGSIPGSLAKQAKGTAAISDVIAATKTGYINYHCVIGNSDTSGIVIKMIANAGNVTDTDGNVYQSVRIGNQVWTVENLRVTKYNDGSSITLDTSSTTWETDTSGKYCFYNNTTNAVSINKFGALYNWHAVNTGRLAPAGWRVPSDYDWITLQEYLRANKYNWDRTTTENKTSKSLATKTDWIAYSTAGTTGCDLTMNNSSGFSALPCGYRNDNGIFNYAGRDANWWSTSVYDVFNAVYRNIHYDGDYLNMGDYNKKCGFSVRLLKDN